MAAEAIKIRDFTGHSQAVYGLTYDEGTKNIFSGSADGMIVRWRLDLPDGQLLHRYSASVYSLACIGDKLLAGCRDSHLLMLDTASGRMLRNLDLRSGAIFDIHVHERGILVLTESGVLWSFDEQLNVSGEFKLGNKSLRNICRMNDGWAIAASDASVHLLNSDYQKTGQIGEHDSSVFSVCYHTESSQLISAGRDAQIKVHLNNLLVKNIQAHWLHIHRLALNTEAGLLASCSMDKTIRIWELNGFDLLKVIDFEKLEGHVSSVNKILWIDKNTLISCSDDRTLKCFEIKEK